MRDALSGAYRVVLYPFILVVAVAGLMTGRYLESSGILHDLLEGAGTTIGVPDRVFQDSPGQPRRDAPATDDDPDGPVDDPVDDEDDVEDDLEEPDDEPTPEDDLVDEVEEDVDEEEDDT